ncbi:Uncharacterised protein [Streptococcus pneumoniae]|nr:Uncharacterised protein [Streptococcus pneumoniae]
MMSQFEIMDTEIFAKVEGGLGGWEEVAFQKIIWFGWIILCHIDYLHILQE